jgi:cobalamin biosynthesis Mg chelatase CobN
MKKFLWFGAPLVLALGVMTGGAVAGFAASSAPPPAPPGQGDCSHGNTGKACRPDPQPEHGKDCESHGNDGIGGVNEDHCLGTSPTTSTDVTTTSQTTTNETTSSDVTTTSQTSTNETTSSDVTTTSQTTTNETTSSATTTNKTTTPATTTISISGTVTTAESTNDGPSAAAPAVTTPQLEAELAKQAAKVGAGRVSPERDASGQLPFTGSSVWILALLGSALLAAGLGVRRLIAQPRKP